MTRTDEIRDRMTEDSRIEAWIGELLSRLPLEDAQPETPSYRFAETVKIPRYRVRHAVSEAWFDRTTSTAAAVHEPRPQVPTVVHYPAPETPADRRRFGRRIANRLLAGWWRLTGQGTANVAWSLD